MCGQLKTISVSKPLAVWQLRPLAHHALCSVAQMNDPFGDCEPEMKCGGVCARDIRIVNLKGFFFFFFLYKNSKEVGSLGAEV